MQLSPLPSTFADTREALKLVAVHIIARARTEASGRFGLRVAPGGFATTDLTDDLVRVRVTDGILVHEAGPTAGAVSRAIPIDGSSLAALAAFAEVDIAADLDVGSDTPEVGDPEAPMSVDFQRGIGQLAR